MAIRIAFIDNDIEFLDVRSEFLRQAGFIVHTASSVDEARRVLDHKWVHAAVIDIRLQDQQDDGDLSGIDLARNPQYQTIPKIILTQYPHWHYVKHAMGPRLRDLPPAVDFIDKADGAETLINAIHTTADKFLDINWSLKTHWRPQGLSYTALTQQFTPSGEIPQLVDRAAEVEDLFRMLFSDYSHITIDRLLWQQRDRLALVVFAFNENLPGRQVLVTFGSREVIQRERHNYDTLAAIGSMAGIPQLVNHRVTLHFAANAVELPGSDLETIKTFAEIHASSNARDIKAVLQSLNPSGTSLWHSHRRLALEPDLGALFRQRLQLDSPDKVAADLEQKIAAISRNAAATALATITRTPDGLKVHVSPPFRRTFTLPDPVLWLLQAQPLKLEMQIMLANTLGDLQAESLLVDTNTRIWLSDLVNLAEGPISSDFAALESSLKFDLAQGETLSDLHECEQLLMAPERLSDRGESGPTALQKTMTTVRTVRALAAATVGDDPAQYLLALAYNAVKRILAYNAETERAYKDVISAIHACLSLGVIISRLSELQAQVDPEAMPSQGLQVDEANRQVTVDGRIVQLSPAEYRLIHHLWQCENQLCGRKELYAAAFGESYTQGRASPDDARFNMLIKRLREAIEPDPGNPLYLVTRRGEGYTLFPQGKPSV